MDKKMLFTRRTPGMTEAETELILNIIRKTETEGIAEYEAMTNEIGRDVRKFCRNAIRKAIRQSLREGIVMEVVPNVGYKRLNPSETIDISFKTIARVRRASIKASVKLSTVDPSALPGAEKTKYFSLCTSLNTLTFFSNTQSVESIRKKSPATILPIGKVFELFSGETREDS